MRRRRFDIIEEATYPDDGAVKVRTVETDLPYRRAVRAAAEWQAASNRNKLLVMAFASSARNLPNVVFRLVASGGVPK